MSSFNNIIGGGADLSIMPSGERYLMGTVGVEIWLGGVTNVYNGRQIQEWPDGPNAKQFDFSTIQSITWEYPSGTSGGGSVTISLDYPDLAVKVPKGEEVVMTLTDDHRTGTHSIHWSSGWSGQYTYFKIKSYTTTDGKVHTASNLNY